MKRHAIALLFVGALFGATPALSSAQDKFLDFNLSLFSPQCGGYSSYGGCQTGIANYTTTYQTQSYTTAYPAPVAYSTYTAPVYAPAVAYAAPAVVYPAPAYAVPAAAYPVYQPVVQAPVYYPAFSQTTVSAPVTTTVNYTYSSYARPRYPRRSHLLEFSTQLSPVPCWNPLFSMNVGLF